MIRKNDESPCPFGLPIPFGCKHAGNVIEKMAPLDMLGEEATPEEKKKVSDANVRVLAWSIMGSSLEPKKCPYAAKLFDQKEAVECNYEDTAPGMGDVPLAGSPFYSQIFSGVGLEGLYSYPIGYYSDFSITRNLYYGALSLQGSVTKEEIKKLANKFLEDARIAKLSFSANK